MKFNKFAIFAIGFSFAVVAGASAQTTQSILLKGTVPSIFETSIVEGDGLAALDLSQPITDLVVATLSIRSNKKSGYNVTITSANGGYFKTTGTSTDPSTDQLAYSLTYGGADVTLGDAISTSDRTSTTGVSAELKLSYTAPSTYLPYEDTYSDTLTVAIAAN